MTPKILKIFNEAVPVIIMIALIPVILNDYLLTATYIAVILIASLIIKRKQYDGTVFIFGFIVMIASEYLFISTGVEAFNRTSLFGLMPLWLPFLWAYSFVAIKRSVIILSEDAQS